MGSYFCGENQPTSLFKKKATPSDPSATRNTGSCIGHPSPAVSVRSNPLNVSGAYDIGGDSSSNSSGDNEEADNDAILYSVLGFLPPDANFVDDKPEADSEAGLALASDDTAKEDFSDGADDKAGVDATAHTDNDAADAIAANGDSAISKLRENVKRID